MYIHLFARRRPWRPRLKCLRPRPHQSVFKRKRGCFTPFSKRFASTLIVFVSFSPVHTTTPIKRESTIGSVCPPFWILTLEWSGAWSCLFWWRHRFQIASFSPSTLGNIVFKSLHSGERFRMAPFSVIWKRRRYQIRHDRAPNHSTMSIQNGGQMLPCAFNLVPISEANILKCACVEFIWAYALRV